MNKIIIAVMAMLFACVLSACSGYTQVKAADGTEVTRGHVAPGTTVVGPAGGCIDSTGGNGCTQVTPTTPAE